MKSIRQRSAVLFCQACSRIAGPVASLRPRLQRGDRTRRDRRTAGADSFCADQLSSAIRRVRPPRSS